MGFYFFILRRCTEFGSSDTEIEGLWDTVRTREFSKECGQQFPLTWSVRNVGATEDCERRIILLMSRTRITNI